MIGRLQKRAVFWLQRLIESSEKYHGLHRLDQKLKIYLPWWSGFFVEVGANDGVTQSNTCYFERNRNWRGLLIEPVPHLAQECRRNRPNSIIETCALVSPSYMQKTVEMYYCNLMTIQKGSMGNAAADMDYIESGTRFLKEGENSSLISVPAATFDQVMLKHNITNIDFMSLDVEGAELNVLEGFDYTTPARLPKYLLVEVWHDKRDSIEVQLSRSYRMVDALSMTDSYTDILYKRNDL